MPSTRKDEMVDDTNSSNYGTLDDEGEREKARWIIEGISQC